MTGIKVEINSFNSPRNGISPSTPLFPWASTLSIACDVVAFVIGDKCVELGTLQGNPFLSFSQVPFFTASSVDVELLPRTDDISVSLHFDFIMTSDPFVIPSFECNHVASKEMWSEFFPWTVVSLVSCHWRAIIFVL